VVSPASLVSKGLEEKRLGGWGGGEGVAGPEDLHVGQEQRGTTVSLRWPATEGVEIWRGGGHHIFSFHSVRESIC
jgi:hypothetical protein